MEDGIVQTLFPCGEPGRRARISGVKALPEQLLGAGGGSHTFITHAPGNIQHGFRSRLEQDLPINVVGKTVPRPLRLLVNLRKRLRIGHAGGKGKQRDPWLLRKEKHVIPSRGNRLPPSGQRGGFVDFMEGLLPFSLRAKAHRPGLWPGVCNRQPEKQRPLPNGRKIGAGEAEAAFLGRKGGNPAVGAPPYGMKWKARSFRLHVGADQPGIPADLQKALELHVQEGNALHRTVGFPDGGQGQVFVAGDLIVHRTSILCYALTDPSARPETTKRF